MNRFWIFLLDARTLSVLGLAALAAFLFIGASTLELALVYVAVAVAVVVGIWSILWAVRRVRSHRAGRRLGQALAQDASQASKGAPRQSADQLDVLRSRLLTAVKTIKGSKLGETTGSAALYELPWYIVIGNPAAGKSTAIVKSGLTFPFADSGGSVIQGTGGTRNCDWFFTNEGILLDTAGRYSVHDEDRQEWFGFLSLLKTHRPKAPINGMLIAVSLAELMQARPEATIRLAKNLRQRVQELTEKLEVFAPVYLVFTKADLVSGFVEMFEDRDRAERDKVWGATFPYDPEAKTDSVALFDTHFDELREGLKEVSIARMSLNRGRPLPPGVLTFPLEFASLQPALRSFVATLFEDNPYQFRPVFRGFYFTSSIQEGESTSPASEQVAQQFALEPHGERTRSVVTADNGFFLKDLFSKVIFADRNLVRQFASRKKLRARAFTFVFAVVLLAAALGGWSWSYLGNRRLMTDVRADLDMAAKLQQGKVDLASRLDALEVLQDRIEQLSAWHASHPVTVGLGLYQGDVIERKLRDEYFAGMRQVMLRPVAQSLETFLGEVNANAARLQPMPRLPESAAPSLTAAAGAASAALTADARRAAPASTRFAQASPDSVEDAYNALKTYLMLAERQRLEPGHLTDQITRFWRGWLEQNRGTMPNEKMIHSAERMISFSMANLQDPSFPLITDNLTLVDQTRENLRRVARGTPARDRVYADVKARASTRYAPITVTRVVGDLDRDVVAGSYVVPGTFTHEAWRGYVEAAFKEAATKELQSVDWVLKTSAADDLSLQGSPDQVRKALTDLYKTEYVREWQRFMQGITVAEFGSFDRAVARMNRLGDPADSPIKKLMTTLLEQTSWDNPSLLNERLAQGQRGFVEWFKQTVLRQAPSQVTLDLQLGVPGAEMPMGPIGREFSALSRIMMTRDNAPSLLSGYLQTLSKLRSKFNDVKRQGDAGPAARQMMVDTLGGGSGSEMGDALKFIDEQMLVGMTDTARSTLRPLLVRPLIQSFAVIVPPTETEVNRIWSAQVVEPFQRTLAAKYPFDTAARIEATPQDIAAVFGPAGAIAKFTGDALGPLVVRRGDTVTPKTWAEMGLHLRPEFNAGFATWVAQLEGPAGGGAAAPGGSAANGAGGAVASQYAFQILPVGSPGLKEYTLEIDGQVLRYRNGAAVWTPFVWPSTAGVPGSRITAVTNEDRSVEIFNEPGRMSLDRLFEVATKARAGDGINQLTWTKDGQSVTVQLRMVSTPGATPAPSAAAPAATAPLVASGLRGTRLPTLIAGVDVARPADPASAPAGAESAKPAVGATR